MALHKVQQLSIEYVVAGITCFTTHHFRGPDGTNEAPAGLAADFDIAMTTVLRAALDNSITIVAYHARPVAPPEYEHEMPATLTKNVQGSRATIGDLLPPSWCLGASVRTDRASRRAMGRNYWSGAMEPDVGPTGFTSSTGYFKDRINDYYVMLMDRLGEGSTWGATGFSGVFSWCVFSRTAYDQGADDSLYNRAVQSWTVRSGPRHMRSRRS